MKQINGKLVVAAELVTRFEFSEEEVNQVLGASSEQQRHVMRELLNSKNPSETFCGDYMVNAFKSAVAQALVTQRESQLRQIEDKPAVSGEEVQS